MAIYKGKFSIYNAVVEMMTGGNMNKLREIRKEQRMTARKLSIMCGVTRQHLCNIEHGRVQPSVALAKKLGSILHVDWKVFFDDTDNLAEQS